MQKPSKAALLMTYKRSCIRNSEVALLGPISQWELLGGPSRASYCQMLPETINRLKFIFNILQSPSISVESSINNNNLSKPLSIRERCFERCPFNYVKDFCFQSDSNRVRVRVALLGPVDRWKFLAGPSRAKTKKAPVRSLLLLEVTK